MRYEVGPPVDSREAWDELQKWLPEMLDRLLNSEPFDREKRPPDDQRGVYLFSADGQPLYVGRTGITALAQQVGKELSTSFRARFDQHTQDGRPPGSAPFAMRLAREQALEKGIAVPSGWWKEKEKHADLPELFKAAKRRIADEMEMRVVTFDDDARGIRSSVLEMYVHVVLRSPYNGFSTS